MNPDTSQIDQLLQEGWESRLNNVIHGREVSEQALQLARSQSYTAGIVRGLRNFSALYNAMHDYENGLRYANEALALLGEDHENSVDAFDLYLLLAAVYLRLGDIPQSLAYCYKAEDIAVAVADRARQAEVYKTIGNSYLMIEEYENAVSNYDKARQVYREIIDIEGEIIILNNLCHCYHHAGQYDKSLVCGHLGLELYEEIASQEKPILRVHGYNLNNVGMAYIKSDQYDKALPYFEKSLKIFEQDSDQYGEVYSWRGLGEISLHHQRFDDALFQLQRSLELAKQIGVAAEMVKAHRVLSRAYKQMKMPDKALYHYEKFYVFEKSIVSDEIEKKIRNLEAAHRVQQAQKEAEIYQLKTVALQNEINERMKAEQKLQAYAAELKRSNQELEKFAAVVSHDLQAPLRKIITFGDLLQERYADLLDERGANYLARMQNASRRMQELIRNLLELSRVTTHRQKFAEIDLNEVVQEVLNDFEFTIEEKQATIQVSPLPRIEADASQIRQLLQNLISNALKFQRPGVPPVIEISGGLLAESDPEMCQLRVTDNGLGIEEIYQERVFKIFERLHTLSEVEGTGVGLAICRRIVERHGGTITLESVPGASTIFILTLPLHQI